MVGGGLQPLRAGSNTFCMELYKGFFYLRLTQNAQNKHESQPAGLGAFLLQCVTQKPRLIIFLPYPMPAKARTKQAKKHPRWFSKAVLYFFLAFGFLLLSYVGYLDYVVREQFAGKRWSLPAKVYASPAEIYRGYRMTPAGFEDLLQQLHYRRADRLSVAGTYVKKGRVIKLTTRPFRFWDQQQKSQRLSITFAANTVQKITDLNRNTQVPLLRMEPVHISSFYPTRKEDRVLIKLENTPNALIQGIMATEDRDFYQHFGLSVTATARALWANIRAGAVVQGGSTITQQLVKNFYLTGKKQLWRKINEALMALILEYHYQKDEILEAYLNEIYLGQDGASAIHGFGLASEFYFGRPLNLLPLADLATLVALLRGPSYYNPRRYHQRAIKRRNLVLNAMHQQGYISEQQALLSQRQQLTVVAYTHRSVNRYPAFSDLVKRQLRRDYQEEDLTSAGLRIFTTLDTRVQNILQQTISRKLRQLEKRPKSNKLQTAIIVTRRDSGEIIALAGDRNAQGAGFNRALDALRPIGSLIKPVVYLTALSHPNRYHIVSKISDTTIKVKNRSGQLWQPKNYDNKQHGEVPLYTALAHSYNLATVRLGLDIGVERVAKTLKSMGVSRPLDLFPSLLLGASPLTPLEVTQIYQTLAGDGFATPLRSIQAVVAADGKRLQSYPFTLQQAVDSAASYLTNTILQTAMRSGTGRSAYSQLAKKFALVGKTGTTNKLRDSWFAGFSGDYLAVVWVGRDDNKPAGLTGATGALPLWSTLMRQISTKPVALIAPDTITTQWINPADGLLANETCAGAVRYPFIKGSGPEQYSACVASPANKAKTWLRGLFGN